MIFKKRSKSRRPSRQLCLDSDKCNFWVIFDFRFSLRPSSWSWRPTKLIRCWIGVYRNAPSCLLSTEPLQWPKKMAISLLGQRYVEYIKTFIKWLFHRQFVYKLYYNTDILRKKIGPSWLFLAAGTTDTKFRHSTGVATANSTNKYQKYKSVELGDQLAPPKTLAPPR